MSTSLLWKWGLIAVIALAVSAVLWPRGTSRNPDDHLRSALRAIESDDQVALRRELNWFRGAAETGSYRSLLAGVLLLKDDQPNAALAELQHATKDAATRVDAWTYAAEAYYRLHHFSETVAVARSALEVEPRAHPARRWLAVAYYDLGAVAPASEQLHILAREVPTDGRPHRLLALIAKDNEQFREAVEYYLESLRRDPQPSDLHALRLELAECQLKLQDHAGCLESLSELPITTASLVLRAEAQVGLGLHDPALDSVNRSLSIDDQHVPSLILKATILLTRSQPDAAVPLLKRTLEIQPFHATARFKLSQAFNQLGQPDLAAEQSRLMEESRRLEREFVDLHHEAAADLNSAEIRFRLGTLAHKLGKPDLAKMWFRAAVAIDPNHVEANRALKQ
jgi:tetratricopeptide (TPR) repeat protein